MRKATIFLLIFVETLALFLVSCTLSGTGTDPAARAIEDYLKALVAKDSSRLSTLSCTEWVSNAMTEMDSFQAVTAKLENLSCQTSGTEGKYSLVSCKGKIVATYNGENQEIDLSVRTYQIAQQDGEYLVCGYR